jgi:FAD dependent oxidoreductase TIGR03364
MRGSNTIEADVCVVGAGIVGLAHAHEAFARGLRVTVLERGDRAVGASVRNFGHCFFSAMGEGRALECALRARERWLELGRRAGLAVLESGSLVVARHEDELAVLESLACDERRGTRMITAGEAAELAPIPVDGLIGGLHAQLDVRVDPRDAVAGLASLLSGEHGARVVWGAPVHAVQPGLVESAEVRVRAPVIIACPGPDFDTLPAQLHPRRSGLTRCKLQMLRVAPPHGRRCGPALLTGLSLLRYPAFSAQPGIDCVRKRLESERPELLAAGIHLIVTQLPDGDLIVGDTHTCGWTVSPFADEQLDRLVLEEARRLLGVQRLEVRERWHGVYPYAPGEPFMITAPLPGVRVVEVVSGVGMTTALGLAPLVLDEELSAVSPRSRDSGSRPATRRPSTAARAGL